MATKKYLSYDGLTEYDALIKTKIDEGDSSTLSSSKAYTDEKIASIPKVDAYTKSEMDSAIDSAKAYADEAVANLLDNATPAVDSIYELKKAMEDNAGAIEALVAISGSKADKGHVHDELYYTKEQINDLYYTKEQIDSFELITTDEIDIICGGVISYAEDVIF